MNRCLFFGSTLLSLSFLSSSAVGEDQVIKPFKRVVGSKAIVESTLTQDPQIQESSNNYLEHRAPRYIPPWKKINQPPNGLIPGEVQKYERGTILGKFPGIGATGYEPPDCDFAVGPSYVVDMVNVEIAFFNKANGTKLFQTSLNSFFASLNPTGSLFDPKAFYDKASGRFFVLCDETDSSTVSKVLIAVSDDSDPNGVWYKYRVEAKLDDSGKSYWLDYPGFGSNKDAVVVTGNMFQMGGNGVFGVEFIAIGKAQLLTGAAPVISYLKDNTVFTVQPARSSDPTDPRLFLVTDYGATALRMYAITGLPAAPIMTASNVTVPNWQLPTENARSAGGKNLDSFDGRIFGAQWRGGKFVTAHTVKDSGGNRTMVRWYQINTGNWPTSGAPSLGQSGNIRSSGSEDYHMPAIAINKFDDISVIFTRSSDSIVADLMIASRKSTDGAGQMGAPKRIETSTGNTYGGFSNRWGDYFAATVDPSDDTTFWGYGEVGKQGSDWTTFWDKWLVSGGVGDGNPFPPTTISLYQGTSESGTVADVATSNDVYYTVKSAFMAKLGHVAAWEAGFTLAQGAGQIDVLTFRHEGKAAAGSTAFLYLYNWGTGDYDFVKAFPLQDADFKTDLNLTLYGLDKYVSGTNEVKLLVRAILPNRPRGSIPAAFDFKTDLLNLLVIPKP